MLDALITHWRNSTKAPFFLFSFFIFLPNSHMKQLFARTPGFVVRLCPCQPELLLKTCAETWMCLSLTWLRTRSLTAVRPSPTLWPHTRATARTTWWPETAEARWCSCRRSANSSSCAWCRSRFCASCRSPSCSAFSSSVATWWSNQRAWLTSWWKTGDRPKTWRPSWWGSARAMAPDAVERLRGDPKFVSAQCDRRRSLCVPDTKDMQTFTLPSKKWLQASSPTTNVCA